MEGFHLYDHKWVTIIMIDVGFAYSMSGEAISRIVKPTFNYFGSGHH